MILKFRHGSKSYWFGDMLEEFLSEVRLPEISRKNNESYPQPISLKSIKAL